MKVLDQRLKIPMNQEWTESGLKRVLCEFLKTVALFSSKTGAVSENSDFEHFSIKITGCSCDSKS